MSIKDIVEIRKIFFDFFSSKDHKIIPSSSLIPNNDSSLLFTNAGMNQFKDIFLGLKKKKYSRVVTSQCCVRAGGKDNDLENVGYSDYHHTFFEMLGNFSFGDYFKEEAIQFAWEFLTSNKWLNLDKNKIWVTVYKYDKESYKVWKKEIGLSKRRIIKIGNKSKNLFDSENFWRMGNIGPCGPCTEIFYNYSNIDYLNFYKDKNNFVEIWNIVFMEFNRNLDGKFSKLPMLSVDTGMGLERICSVLQGVKSNYKINFFKKLIKSIANTICFSNLNHDSLKVIADHIRSSIFIIAEGVIPSNEGRGYVLRRIIRRAIRHLYLINYKNPILFKLVGPLFKIINEFNDTSNFQKNKIEKIIKNEEEQFNCILKNGLNLLEKELKKIKNNILSGSVIFKLCDTYGLQFDIIKNVCRDRNIKIEKDVFDLKMEKHKKKSKKNNHLIKNTINLANINFHSDFLGYKKKKCIGNVLGIFQNGKLIRKLKKQEKGIIILDKTTFYPESGGQIGDNGFLIKGECKFIVENTKKYNYAIGHIGQLVFGSIELGDIVESKINIDRRKSISLNHSATHLLYGALRMFFGNCIKQKGSFINEKMFSFDFSYFRKIAREEINQIESIVNSEIRKNYHIEEKIISLKEAKKKGLLVLDEEKYSKEIRILKMNNFSVELCRGTHVKQTGEIGLFFIKNESSISSGIRRIESVTGKEAIYEMQKNYSNLLNIKKIMKCSFDDLVIKIKNIINNFKIFKKEINILHKKKIEKETSLLMKNIKEFKKISLLLSELNNFKINDLFTIVKNLKNKLKYGIIVLSTKKNKNFSLIIGVTNNLLNKIDFNSLLNFIKKKINGKVKSITNLAIVSSSNTNKVSYILIAIKNWIEKKIV